MPMLGECVNLWPGKDGDVHVAVEMVKNTVSRKDPT